MKAQAKYLLTKSLDTGANGEACFCVCDGAPSDKARGLVFVGLAGRLSLR